MTDAHDDLRSDLLAQHDALLLDIDGTLLRGSQAMPGAPEVLAAATARGLRLAYLTNNASRSSAAVAAHLNELGFQVAPEDVITSAQVAARLLAERVPRGAEVLVLGSAALAAEVQAVGLVPIEAAAEAAAVVQGFSPDLGWRQLAEGCLAIRAGARWVATNVDPTLPTERGLLPGNGSLVAALRLATGADPEVAGKPQAAMFRAAVERIASRRPLMVGDRLDSDIAGANASGLPSLLVLTGVSDARAVLDAPAAERPGYLAADLTGLTSAPERLRPGPQPGWKVTRDEAGLVLHALDEPQEERHSLGALRALCAERWADDHDGAYVRAADPDAAAALEVLGLQPRRSTRTGAAEVTVAAQCLGR